MKKRLNKALALFLAMATMLCFLNIGASAAATSGTCGDDARWSLNTRTGVLTVTGTGSMSYGIPYSGYTEIVISEGIDSLEAYSLDEIDHDITLRLPLSLEYIEEYAFDHSPGIKTVYYAGTVEDWLEVSANAMYYGYGGDKINWYSCPFYYAEKVYFDGVLTEELIIPGPDSEEEYYGEIIFPSNAFQGSWYKRLQLPNGLTAIGAGAFRGCSGLTELVIPDSVKTIGDGAFFGCENLEKLTLPKKLSRIGEYAFSGCMKLTELDIPDRVVEIDSEAFSYSLALKSVTLPASLYVMGECVFSNEENGMETVIVKGSVIGETVFAYCDTLKVVYISKALKWVDLGAFFNTGLTDVYYEGSEEDRESIIVDNRHDGNDPFLNATWHYNTPMPGTQPSKPVDAIKNYAQYNDKILDYKTTITFTPNVKGSQKAEWSVVGASYEVNGDNTCTVKKAKTDFVVICRIMDAQGNMVNMQAETIRIKHTFMDKLMYFFSHLFKSAAPIVQSYLNIR